MILLYSPFMIDLCSPSMVYELYNLLRSFTESFNQIKSIFEKNLIIYLLDEPSFWPEYNRSMIPKHGRRPQ